ncbi:MAG: hypothetical protein A2Y23_00020 [Clostridiales bacterium GWB2_37_7]|nr:MAG: hypothetical protein A2Y23_00020 [Clostridiales bacterium GWB2_37_7]
MSKSRFYDVISGAMYHISSCEFQFEDGPFSTDLFSLGKNDFEINALFTYINNPEEVSPKVFFKFGMDRNKLFGLIIVKDNGFLVRVDTNIVMPDSDLARSKVSIDDVISHYNSKAKVGGFVAVSRDRNHMYYMLDADPAPAALMDPSKMHAFLVNVLFSAFTIVKPDIFNN